jgi:hypothetical protein
VNYVDTIRYKACLEVCELVIDGGPQHLVAPVTALTWWWFAATTAKCPGRGGQTNRINSRHRVPGNLSDRVSCLSGAEWHLVAWEATLQHGDRKAYELTSKSARMRQLWLEITDAFDSGTRAGTIKERLGREPVW